MSESRGGIFPLLEAKPRSMWNDLSHREAYITQKGSCQCSRSALERRSTSYGFMTFAPCGEPAVRIIGAMSRTILTLCRVRLSGISSSQERPCKHEISTFVAALGVACLGRDLRLRHRCGGPYTNSLSDHPSSLSDRPLAATPLATSTTKPDKAATKPDRSQTREPDWQFQKGRSRGPVQVPDAQSQVQEEAESNTHLIMAAEPACSGKRHKSQTGTA